MTKSAFARVLCDVGAHGLKAGQILEADPALIKALEKDGSVDPHKEAVAFARSQGAETVRSSVIVAAEKRAAEADALRIEIAHLESLRIKEGTDEATISALSARLTGLQSRLSELVALG